MFVISRKVSLRSAQSSYFCCDTADEGLNVQLGRTTFLAGCVDALQTASGFLQSSTFTQRRMFDIVEIIHQRLARLIKGKVLGWIICFSFVPALSKHTEQDLSSFLFQFFFSTLVMTLGFKLAWKLTFGFNARRFSISSGSRLTIAVAIVD